MASVGTIDVPVAIKLLEFGVFDEDRYGRNKVVHINPLAVASVEETERRPESEGMMKVIIDGLRDPRERWGMVWRLCVLPITCPLLAVGRLFVGLSQLIAHGEWRNVE